MTINRKVAATVGLAVPAVMALGLSADTSFRFLGSVLGVVNPVERGVLTCTAEAAIIALTLYAWAAGARMAAYLAYGVVLVQSVPAFQVSGGYGGMVRTALGPVLLVVLLHMLLGLELRMTGARSSGLVASTLRELRERLTAYLGIGRRGTDSAAIARSRAADRAVVLTGRARTAKGRKRTRLLAKLAESIDASRHGLDAPAAQAAESEVVSRVVRRKSVEDLVAIEADHAWTTGQDSGHADTVPDTERTRAIVPRTAGQDIADNVPFRPDTLSGHADRTADRTADNRTGQRTRGQDVPDTRTGHADRTADSGQRVRTVVPMSGSVSATVRDILSAHPDMADSDVHAAVRDRFGPDTKPDSVRKAIRRARTVAS